MLEIRQLLIHRDGTPLHYDLKVHTGELLTLQGASGAGKTTLLHCIAGFEQPESGEILFKGNNLCRLAADKRPVAMLFQDHNLFEHLSAWKNISVALPEVSVADIEAAAERLGIKAMLQKMPSQMSGGQRQRLALLRTMLRPEPIVLLDEPFAELDSKTRTVTAKWVLQQAKAQNKTVILVTHQDDDVALVSDRNFVLPAEKNIS